MAMVADNKGKLSCCPMQFPHMEAEGNMVPGNKFKIIVKQLLGASEDKSHGSIVKDIVYYEQRDRVTNGGRKHREGNALVKKSMPVNSSKRRAEMSLVGQRAKKQKIDRSLELQLSKILKELINHRAGPIFSEPVDPVKLRIPDYFSIITKPMDLGTILNKLEENMYSSGDEFAADVRLTFSNAMLYNPPWHEVHQWAKTLDAAFRKKWKLLEAKIKDRKKNDEGARFVGCMGNNGRDAKQVVESIHGNVKPIGLNKAPLPVKLGTCRLMSLEEKQKFRLELTQVLSRQMIDKLRTVFQKFGLVGVSEERLDDCIDSIDDKTLWKLRREVKVLLSENDGEVNPGKTLLNGCSSLNKVVEKEHCRQSAFASVASSNNRQSIDSTESGCSSCVGRKCHCLRNGAAQGSASDLSFERSAEENRYDDSKVEHEIKYPSESLTSSCGLDSDGPGLDVNEANSSHLSTPASVEGWTFNVLLSPKKALRAAMLKRRFADTIFRATHQELLDNSEKSDPIRMQQERERLEREQLEEKARIEAQIKAAEAASRMREQDNLKMRREIERKAARIALEKMEKTVEVDDNVGVLKGLKMMRCGYQYYPSEAIHHGNPLEQLGLHRKDDFFQDDDDAILNVEEGEIV